MNLNFQTLDDEHTNESTSKAIEWSCEYLRAALTATKILTQGGSKNWSYFR